MISLKLEKDNFVDIDFQIDDLSLKKINKENYSEIEKINMMELIEKFNQQYTWDNMFNINHVEERIYENQFLFILYFNEKPIGYNWYKKINDESMYLYNLYVTKIINRPKNSPKFFVNQSCKEMFNVTNIIFCDCDEWNTAAQTMLFDNNFKQY
jgi:hypothetical protein